MRKLYLFISFVALCTLPSPAWATSGTLTITTNTTLTETHDGNIIIAADNVTLDCAEHLVTGSGIGILLQDRQGVTVKNCRVAHFTNGIVLVRSKGNFISTTKPRTMGSAVLGLPIPPLPARRSGTGYCKT